MSGPLFYDRVKETSTTTGTGTYTLAGAMAGYQSFAAVGNGNTCYYCAENGTDWEVGLGTYTASGTTLARTTILASSNSGAAVSWAAGTKHVFLVLPATAVPQYLHYREEQAQNTSGGTFTSGAWRTRVLNTEVSDVAGLGSLASNQITLAAGTYVIRAHAPAFAVNRHQLRLQNVTDATTLLVGSTEYAAVNTQSSQSAALLEGVFTIAAGKALELQHQCQTTAATLGLGVEANFTTEVYAVVELWKIK